MSIVLPLELEGLEEALNPEGISLTPKFGIPQINQRLMAVGISDIPSMGQHKLIHLIQVEGVFTNTMFGGHSILLGEWTLNPTGILNEILLGNPRLYYAANDAASFIKVSGQWVAVEKTMVKHQGE